MKIRKIIIIIFLGLLPVIIYATNIDKKIYYLSLGDSLAVGQNPYREIGYGYSDYVSDYLNERGILQFYTKKYSVSGYRTTDLIRAINDNKKIKYGKKEIAIKNALTNADIVTVSIGLNDLLYKINLNNIDLILENEENLYAYVDEVVSDIASLVTILKRYCKEDIILIGYYNPLFSDSNAFIKSSNKIFKYANESMSKLADHNNLYYVNIYDIFQKNIEYLPNPVDIHPSSEGYSAISKEIISIIEKNIIN